MEKERKRSLWTCPRCRQRFVTRNAWHSCTSFKVDDFFGKRVPGSRSQETLPCISEAGAEMWTSESECQQIQDQLSGARALCRNSPCHEGWSRRRFLA